MSHPRPSIALVTVWFGPLPFWMPAFLLSCAHNPDVEWRIFTDAPAPAGSPENVRFLPFTLTAFNERASRLLGAPVALQPAYAYKLCDYKILYGDLFAEELRGFDVWGCCDLDIVWGRVRGFATDARLRRHALVTSRPQRIAGHCCLFRNQPRWNRLYRRIPGVRDCLLDASRYRGVDESLLSDLLLHRAAPPWRGALARAWDRHLRQPVLWREQWSTPGKHQRRLLSEPGAAMRWEGGRAYDGDGVERMYLHFHVLRATMREIDFTLENAPPAFRVFPGGFTALPPVGKA